MFEPKLPLLPLVLDRVPPGLRQALAQEGIAFVDRRPNRVEGRFVLFDSRSGAAHDLATGQSAIDIDDLRTGWAGDPYEDLLDERSGRFRWRCGAFNIHEEIARVDKRAVRRHVMNALRARIEAAGGIWFTLAAYPFPYRSAFHLRLDHDDYDADDFDRVFRAIAGYEHATSHFICAATHERHPEALKRLRGIDVGLQGYLRHTYQDAEDNLRNIRRGIECLRSFAIEPRGFAAAAGRFNFGLLTALQALGISHSSELGLAYDELPFFVGGGEVLQIPIHPVSLGLFLEAAADRHRDARTIGDDSNAGSSSRRLWFDQIGCGDSTLRRLSMLEGRRGVLNAEQEATVGRNNLDAAVDAAIAHFCKVAEDRYYAGEPIFFHGHPNGRDGRHPRLLTTVLGQVSQFAACWLTSMSGMNAWWRARASARVRVLSNNMGYSVILDQRPKGFRLTGEYWRGEHVARVPLDGEVIRLVPESLAFEARRALPTAMPVRIDTGHRMHRIRDGRRRFEEEERPHRLRSWVSRTFRRQRDS